MGETRVTGRKQNRQRTAALPAQFVPQLATLVAAPPEGDVWLHELKYDGYRIGCRIDGGTIRLLSRNGKDWTSRFADVRTAAATLRTRRALLDGEVVVLLPDGRTSFQALQNTLTGTAARGEIVYYLFDLLHLEGEDVSQYPLEERKARLQRLLGKPSGIIRYADHVIGRGAELFAQACRQGAEGIVSKRRDLPYRPGRGPGWLKTKCIKRQEFVVGGFTDPEGSRVGIGALLIGVHDANGALQFAGKVGTGFTQASARSLRQQLESLAQTNCPFAQRPAGRLGREAHWIRPKLVAEVAFTEWTDDGKIRHPSFQGIRGDKSAAEVVHERPVPTSPARKPPKLRVSGSFDKPRISRKAAAKRPSDATTLQGVRLTHPDRVLYPDIGLTKLELAHYYESVAEWIVPHVADRPLTLVRCPQGIGDSCFYMKHSHVWAPEPLRRVRVREKTKVGEYLVADSLPALVGLVQMDILEIHTWNSTATRLEEPDRIVFDLDPGPRVAWPATIAAARLVRSALEAVGLQSFVKTTGGRGLHVVVPVQGTDWSGCLKFSRSLAEMIERHTPSLYTTAFAKAGRERKILVDYLRNNRTNTSVAAFSTRARPGAPVSVPLAWDELSVRIPSNHYTVNNIGRRLDRLRTDPWKAYWTLRQRIPPDAVTSLNTTVR